MNTLSVPVPRGAQPAPTGAEHSQIVLKDFNFYYGKYHALKNINMEVFKQRVTAFIGPSGCGKSTLLRTLNRMYDLYPEQRAEGQLLLNGKNLLDRDVDVIDLRARVGMGMKPGHGPAKVFGQIALHPLRLVGQDRCLIKPAHFQRPFDNLPGAA